MSKVKITKAMLDNLEYDNGHKANESKNAEATAAAATGDGGVGAGAGAGTGAGDGVGDALVTPSVMLIFDGCDMNAAIYHLTKSMASPFAASAIASVLVQESVREDFVVNLKAKLPAPSQDVASHAGFTRANALIGRLQLLTITANDEPTHTGASVVCDVTHEQLGAGRTGVVTLHTFRTVKEAIALCGKETLAFGNATIWCHNHALAYEVVVALRCPNYFINCHRVSLAPLQGQIDSRGSFVTLDKSYHYETLQHNGTQKSIVFPFGTIFAN